jgi:Dyp-type peroxidase family
MAIDLNQTRIDPQDAKLQKLFQNLQGNILKSHGRNFSTQLLFNFKPTTDTAATRQGVRALTEKFVTSAAKQFAEREALHTQNIPGGTFGNLFLSASGYQHLGISKQELDKGFAGQTSFLQGMAQAVNVGDDTSQWEPPYQGKRIDAMLLLADSDPERLRAQMHAALGLLEGFATVLQQEEGQVLLNQDKQHIEHFGYVDGVSQPLFLESDITEAGDKSRWDPSATLALALVKDPHTTDEDAFGSFFVFRKLQQDVKGFKAREEELATRLGLEGENRALAGAMAVGRFRDGTPVTLSSHGADNLREFNDFDYGNKKKDDAADLDGLKCPFHSHIRKTNPRGDSARLISGVTLESEREHRIVRRAIPYGSPELSAPVGLLFMCFQSDLEKQFVFMQRFWANNSDFVQTKVGLDPLVGQGEGSQLWSKKWDGPRTESFDFQGFIKMRGGEYFFTPSLAFLLSL